MSSGSYMVELIGRAQQAQELNEAVASPAPEMVAVVGRRRIGKTFLVRKIYESRIIFELTGLQNGGKAEQLRNFELAMSRYFPNYALGDPLSEWLDAFYKLSEAIEQSGRNDKVVVFLDELPWLSSPRSGFISALGWFWNTWASRQNILVVICGSAASWMINKVINDRGGLHNRVTRIIGLQPFTLAETEAFCVSRSIRLSRYQILQIHLTIGGVPMYLDRLRPGLSAIQNIQQLCFEPNGYLKGEFDRLFTSLFAHPDRHVAVIKALASKKKGLDRGAIANDSQLGNGGNLSKILQELEQSGFITAYRGYNKRKKSQLYRLTDAYSLFYLTYVQPLGSMDGTDFQRLSDLPRWASWSGYAFENVCLLHYRQIRRALGISGLSTIMSTFIAKGDAESDGAQIDLLIERGDQSINLCEMKFSTGEFLLSKAVLRDFERKKRVFYAHSGTRKHLFLSLITTHGVPERQRGLVDQVVTMDQLFIE